MKAIHQGDFESVESAVGRAIVQADHVEKDECVILTVTFDVEVWPDEKLSDVMLRIIDRVRG